MLFVEQFRPPGCKCIELPAGLAGDKGIESDGQAVRRELAEETGYEPAILRRIGELLQAGRQEHAGCFIGQAGGSGSMAENSASDMTVSPVL